MIQRIIVLDTQAQPKTIHASVNTLFAVTPAIGGHGSDPIGVWTVTHLPTGTAIVTAFSPTAARMAQREIEALPLDWQSGCVTKYRRQWRKYRIPIVGIRERLRRVGIRIQL